MQIATLPNLAVGSQHADEAPPAADRLSLRVSLPLIGLVSASLWWGVWRGVSALF